MSENSKTEYPREVAVKTVTVIWLGALALTLILTFGTSQAWGQRNAQELELSFSIVDTLQLPEEGFVTGMTWMGPDTLAVLTDIPDTLSESGDREIILVLRDREGEVLGREDFTGVLNRTLAWDGEFLWSCGDAQDGSSILYQIEPDTLRVEEAFDAPGHRPVGMCWDGRFLWITDRDSGRVDRFDPEVNEITRSVVTPGYSPFGVAWDGLYMWVTDSGTGRLYRLSGSRRSWNATVDTESFLFRGQDVHLLHDGTTFWILQAGLHQALEIRFD
jgi:hypothetical protein